MSRCDIVQTQSVGVGLVILRLTTAAVYGYYTVDRPVRVNCTGA